MAENERDTHFQGFAELLYQELCNFDSTYETVISEYRNKYDKQEIVQLIAQRAYDLARHVIENLSLHEPYTYEAYKAEVAEDEDDILSHIPDLTEWPKSE